VLEEAAKEDILRGCVLYLFLQLSTVDVRAPGLDWPEGCLQGVFLGGHQSLGLSLVHSGMIPAFWTSYIGLSWLQSQVWAEPLNPGRCSVAAHIRAKQTTSFWS